MLWQMGKLDLENREHYGLQQSDRTFGTWYLYNGNPIVHHFFCVK